MFVVWTSVYGTDNTGLAKEGAAILSDKRVTNYWEPDPGTCLAFGKLVELPRDAPLAYDVYFIYPPGPVWSDDKPPKPKEWMHQILDDPRFMDGNKFRAMVEAELARLPQRRALSRARIGISRKAGYTVTRI